MKPALLAVAIMFMVAAFTGCASRPDPVSPPVPRPRPVIIWNAPPEPTVMHVQYTRPVITPLPPDPGAVAGLEEPMETMDETLTSLETLIEEGWDLQTRLLKALGNDP